MLLAYAGQKAIGYFFYLRQCAQPEVLIDQFMRHAIRQDGNPGLLGELEAFFESLNSLIQPA